MSRFLDRLMLAESGGRDTARNPRSTALGPFQFIEATFLDVVRRHFAAEVADLDPRSILARRTDRGFARRVAEAYSRDNAAHLAGAGHAPTFANLRLAFLVGPTGAVRILSSPSETPAIRLLGAPVVQANPFMAGMTVADLVRWSDRNLSEAGLGRAEAAAEPGIAASSAAPARPTRPQIAVRCERTLASCRRWIALAQQRVARRQVATGGRGRRR